MHLRGVRFGFPLIKRVGLLKHRETYGVPWNRHGGIEIHYVLKGDIAWELQGRERPLAVSGGSFGLVPANVRHRARDNRGTPAVRIGVIFERPSAGKAAGTPFSADDLKRMFVRFRQHGGLVRRFSSRLSDLVRDFAAALTKEALQDADGRLRLRSLASALVYETYVALGEPEALAEGHDVIPKICSWIRAHAAEKITVPQLVKLSGYGRSRFFSLFLADTGLTPNDYLVRIRIDRAKKQLARKALDGSMLDLALACGFNSASAFSTTFRKYVGLPPGEFHARCRLP